MEREERDKEEEGNTKVLLTVNFALSYLLPLLLDSYLAPCSYHIAPSEFQSHF
jgi:hypothetical protein